ncbi:Hypothetical predicted protein [Octopus vulgaris]|uniref:Uncharacterized protein n=1 Tax=Octopus vulgaris TaxID=6645 RepID=A0AA36AW22_OCTVU|nr:Hypothetical predicted protein [Octopus vulgaris]
MGRLRTKRNGKHIHFVSINTAILLKELRKRMLEQSLAYDTTKRKAWFDSPHPDILAAQTKPEQVERYRQRI